MNKYFTLLISSFVIFLTNPVWTQAEETNYCHDSESWKEWDRLVEKYPHDMDIQMLHAVRIGFCQKIEKGSVTFEVARDAFNHLHETVYKKSKKEQEQWLRSKQL